MPLRIYENFQITREKKMSKFTHHGLQLLSCKTSLRTKKAEIDNKTWGDSALSSKFRQKGSSRPSFEGNSLFIETFKKIRKLYHPSGAFISSVTVINY